MDTTPTPEAETVPSRLQARPARRVRVGLSWKLLLLTVLFVMVSEVLIYVPSIANFRLSWLADRLTMADAAVVVLDGAGREEVPQHIQDQLLASVGATAIAIRNGETSRLIASVDMPPDVDMTADLRMMAPIRDIVDAFATLSATTHHTLRVIGKSHSGSVIELVIGDAALRAAMLGYSVNILWLAALVSLITGALLYFTLNRIFVGPLRRLTQNMVSFSEAPEDASRIIRPSLRGDEIGLAEERLAAMQTELAGTLRDQRHLADLGLAVSKVNHDLRNMLASAQLFSDRIGSLPDPSVQRFAPKLIAALDRAIAYTQTTLAYGRARELPPSRRLVALDRLVEDVADALGLDGHPAIAFDNAVPKGLEIDADPDQLFRVLLNLCRNAMQALEGGEPNPAIVRRLSVTGKRDNGSVSIRVADTGPGVPEKARAHLFQAFQGGARPGGTGLGLAIAAEIVRAHGGTIALLETRGAGATFEIVIPDRPGRNGRNGG